MLNLKIIIGSTRPGRAADRVIPWITSAAREHGDFSVDVLDFRDWPLPLSAEMLAMVGDPRHPAFSAPVVKQWNSKIAEGDAYLFITPEYNHSVPAVLKNAIDSVFATFAFRGKPAAYVAYSGGIGGGIRAIEHLAQVAIEAEMVPQRNSVIIPFAGNAFGPDGQPRGPRTSAAAQILLDDLAWWAKALRRAKPGGTPATRGIPLDRRQGRSGKVTAESPAGQSTGSVPSPVAPAPFVRIVIRPMTKVLNPVIVKLGGRRHFGMAAQIQHVGRRSRKAYATPATAHVHGDVILIALTSGSQSDWVRNVRAVDGCTIRINGRTYHAVGPQFLSREQAGPLLKAAFSPMQRAGNRMLGVRQFLRPQAEPARDEEPLGD